jgi:hypothetical protein
MSTEKPRMNVGIDTGLVNVIVWEQDLEGDKPITVKKSPHSGRGYSQAHCHGKSGPLERKKCHHSYGWLIKSNFKNKTNNSKCPAVAMPLI